MIQDAYTVDRIVNLALLTFIAGLANDLPSFQEEEKARLRSEEPCNDNPNALSRLVVLMESFAEVMNAAKEKLSQVRATSKETGKKMHPDSVRLYGGALLPVRFPVSDITCGC